MAKESIFPTSSSISTTGPPSRTAADPYIKAPYIKVMSTPPFAETAAAIAILLSVIVRWIRSGASWQAIEEGAATADVLRDLTGIMSFERLQEVFGPPRLEDGVFPVTRREVLRQRTGYGYLM